MRLRNLAEGSALVGVKCKLCPRTAQPGQSVAYRRNSLKAAPAYEAYFLMHVACMKVLVGRAAPDTDEHAFDAVRAQIVERGHLWAR